MGLVLSASFTKILPFFLREREIFWQRPLRKANAKTRWVLNKALKTEAHSPLCELYIYIYIYTKFIVWCEGKERSIPLQVEQKQHLIFALCVYFIYIYIYIYITADSTVSAVWDGG